MKNTDKKLINLALQGGGAHGAFTWGVLDELLLDERLYIEAISATSAGAVNAVVMADGLAKGGRDGARASLQTFWEKTSAAAALLPFSASLFDRQQDAYSLHRSPSFLMLNAMMGMLSPAQLNPLKINPLRDILEEMIDFERLRQCRKVNLYINATHVRTGKAKIFHKSELTLDMVMASACLPTLFETVWVDGEPYWDGGYSGNPALYPLIYQCQSQDIVLVQINPRYVEEVPTDAASILDRINEISFNASLMPEMRAMEFVSRLRSEGALDDHYKDMHIHLIDAPEVMAPLGRLSKMNPEQGFLDYLRKAGVRQAQQWLNAHYDAIGQKSSVDIQETFL